MNSAASSGSSPDPARVGQSLPSGLLIGALSYGGALLAGCGLFMWLKPDQALIPAASGLPPFAIELVFLGFAVNGAGTLLLMKRRRLLRKQHQQTEAGSAQG